MRALYFWDMKAAKFALCCLLAAISFAISSRPAALIGTGDSSVRYARADSRTVYFYDEIDGRSLFAIPYTYCVQVLETVGNWYKVRYAEDNGFYKSLTGYCRKSGLTPVDRPPENIYLNKTVTVTFKQDLGNDYLPSLGELNVKTAFYGTLYWGESAYSYVLYNDEFAYVNGANDDYPLNEIPAAPEPNPQPSNGANVKLIIVIVLIAVAVIALLILYFTGKTAKFKRG